ncbi:MAG: Uncharacterized amino acid permease, GabP family, partial [uncultured Gemmatimonadaceae bacterium]
VGLDQEVARRAAGRRGGGDAAAVARAAQPHRVRHRLDHRHGDLRAHRHRGVAARGPRARALDGHRGGGVRPRGALLRGARGDDPRRRQRLHLRLRLGGRARRVDDRLGPRPRVRALHRHGGRRLVGLLRELPARLRPLPPARAHRRPGHDGGGGRRHRRRRRLQPPRGAHRARRRRAARRRHPAVGERQHRPRRDEGRGAPRLHRRGRRVRAAREPHPLHPGQRGRVRPLRLERRAARGRRDVLRLHRLRRGEHRRPGGAPPAARHARGDPRLARRVHGALHRGRDRAHRHRPLPAPQRRRPDRRGDRRHGAHLAQPGDQGLGPLRPVQHDARPAPRPDAHLLRDEPRRAPPRRLRPRAPPLPHAAREHRAHRRGGRRRGGRAPDRRAQPAREHRHAARLLARVRGHRRAAPHRAGPRAPLPHAVGAVGARVRRGGLHPPDGRPPLGHVGAAHRLARGRPRALFRLRTAPRRAAARDRRRARHVAAPRL